MLTVIIVTIAIVAPVAAVRLATTRNRVSMHLQVRGAP